MWIVVAIVAVLYGLGFALLGPRLQKNKDLARTYTLGGAAVVAITAIIAVFWK